MRQRTIERMAQNPESLSLWVLHWIINHYNLQLQDIAREMGYTTTYVGQVLIGRYPMKVEALDHAIYNLTKDVVCCKARGEYASYIEEV